MRNSGRNDCGKTNKPSSASSASSSIPTALTKQCLQLNFPNRRFTNEAVNLSSEFLKLVVVEARRRAAIEAECEAEAEINDDDDEYDECGHDHNQHQARALNRNRTRVLEIRSDHISKIAAELLLDIS